MGAGIWQVPELKPFRLKQRLQELEQPRTARARAIASCQVEILCRHQGNSVARH